MRENAGPAQTVDGGHARIAVLVLGMHRSGTSAISRMLSLLGCALPRRLLGPGPGNALGHWESEPIWHFNDELLASGDSSWDDLLAFDTGWYDTPQRQSFVASGRAVLNEEFGEAPLFVMKDPRNCRLVPFWREVLEREHIRPVVVIALRDPDEVAQSLAARDNRDPHYTQHLWLRHMLEAEAQTRDLPRVVASYDRLLSDWPALAAHMEQAFGFAWPGRSELAETAIAQFLSDEQRHHRQQVAGARQGWVGTVYGILDRWPQHGEDHRDHARLDEVRCDLNRAAPNFVRLARSAVDDTRLVRAFAENDRIRKDERAARALADDKLAQEQRTMNHERSVLQQELTQAQKDADERAAAAQADLQNEREASHALRVANAAGLAQIEELTVRLAEADDAQGRLMAEQKQTARRAQTLDASLNEVRRLDIESRRLRRIDALELQERVQKIAALSTQLEQQSKTAAEQIGWLSKVLMLIIARPGWWAAMPKSLRRRRTHQLLSSMGLFDAKGYLARHPDVAEQREDPLRHYIVHGMAEGRH